MFGRATITLGIGPHSSSEYSSFMPVTSGIPHGSVLGPLSFVIYVNDLPMYVKNFADCSLFADNAKLSRYVSNQEDSADLQKGFCALKEWSDYWLLKLNTRMWADAQRDGRPAEPR